MLVYNEGVQGFLANKPHMLTMQNMGYYIITKQLVVGEPVACMYTAQGSWSSH